MACRAGRSAGMTSMWWVSAHLRMLALASVGGTGIPVPFQGSGGSGLTGQEGDR